MDVIAGHVHSMPHSMFIPARRELFIHAHKLVVNSPLSKKLS